RIYGTYGMDIGPSPQFLMERKVHTQISRRQIIKTKLKKSCSFTTERLKNMVMDFFPVLRWLPKYHCREYIWGDVMSGVVIGIILVPQAIAYSLLAGLKPIYSLYTSFFANLIYFLLGTSRHVSVGIFSLLSLMVGQVVDRDTECGKECYVLMGVFRLGFVSMYLSESVLDGFATGASLTILTAQVKYLIGIKIPRSQGHGIVLTTWINIFQNISQANLCDVITSAICIAVLVAAKELGERYKHKLKIPLPTELVVIVVATMVSHYGNLNEVYASSVSGAIPTGFIPPQLPNFNLMYRVAADAVPLAIVGFAFTISLSEMFAKKYAYTVRANQEMFAIGFCNIIPSFFHCFATIVLLVLLFLMDTLVWCVTALSSALISTEMGLLVGVVFSMLCIIVRTQQPRTALLGQIQSTAFYEDNWEYEGLSPVPRTKIFRFEAPLYYANKDFFLKSLYRMTGLDPTLEAARRKKNEKKEKERWKEGDRGTTVKGLDQADTTLHLVPKEVDFQTIIIDCSSITFLDTAGITTLKEILKDYNKLKITVLLACCNPSVIDSLKRGGYFGKNYKMMHQLLFYSIHSAVQFAKDNMLLADGSTV
uniref:Sulfate transporter n=1 Tax=Pelusios castaneus TaxID=367368 RepID=A0A8C8RNK8_9SAUR